MQLYCYNIYQEIMVSKVTGRHLVGLLLNYRQNADRVWRGNRGGKGTPAKAGGGGSGRGSPLTQGPRQRPPLLGLGARSINWHGRRRHELPTGETERVDCQTGRLSSGPLQGCLATERTFTSPAPSDPQGTQLLAVRKARGRPQRSLHLN